MSMGPRVRPEDLISILHGKTYIQKRNAKVLVFYINQLAEVWGESKTKITTPLPSLRLWLRPRARFPYAKLHKDLRLVSHEPLAIFRSSTTHNIGLKTYSQENFVKIILDRRQKLGYKSYYDVRTSYGESKTGRARLFSSPKQGRAVQRRIKTKTKGTPQKS